MDDNSILWTALPAGVRIRNGKSFLRIGLLVSPRLASADPTTDRLRDERFRDFHEWPRLLSTASYTLTLRNSFLGRTSDKTFSIKPTYRPGWEPDARFWRAMFPLDTVVGRHFESTDGGQQLAIGSYDAGLLDFAMSYAYFSAIRSVWLNDQEAPPLVSENPVVGALLDQPLATRDQLGVFQHLDASQLKRAFQGLRVFLSTKESSSQPSTAPPQEGAMDFHELLSAVQQHNGLARKLGLIVDFDVEIPKRLVDYRAIWFRRPSIKIDVGIALYNQPKMLNPWTACEISDQIKVGSPRRWTYSAFHPAQTPKDWYEDPKPPLDQFGFRLMNEGNARFTSFELDWLALHLDTTAKQVAESLTVPADYNAKAPAPMHLQALRSGGISLMDLPNNPGDQLPDQLRTVTAFHAAWTRQEALQEREINQLNPETPLYLEDGLVRGYTVYVRAGSQGDWRSLCSRRLDYDFSSIGIGDLTTWSSGNDEGEISRVIASDADGTRLSPFLFLWDGWSLAVPRPEDPVDWDGKPSAITQWHFKNIGVSVSVGDCSLPRKRFGDDYEFVLPTVDLAGNSWTLEEATDIVKSAALNSISATAHNYRLEPVRPPFVLDLGDGQGEKGTVVVIRSLDASNATPKTVHIFPPDTHRGIVEEHGVFDDLSDDDSYGLLLKIDGHSGEDGDLRHHLDENTPVDVPYVTDPMCRKVILRSTDLGNKWVAVDFPAQDTGMPSARQVLRKSILLSLVPGDMGESSTFHSNGHEITVRLPPGEVLKANLTSGLGGSDPSLFWVTNAITAMRQYAFLSSALPTARTAQDAALLNRTVLSVIQGSEPLVTPPRDLLFVYATQRPLEPPLFSASCESIRVGLNDPSAKLIDKDFRLHVGSTGRIEITARWTDEVDIPFSNDFVKIDGALPPFGYNLSETDSSSLGMPGHPASYWSHPSEADDASQLRRARATQTANRQSPTAHCFPDCKRRTVTYVARAVSRFASYMPEAIQEDIDALSRQTSITIDVKNSAPPAAPNIRAVLPIFRRIRRRDASSGEVSSVHISGLRFLIERPWLSSGPGEMFACVLSESEMSPPLPTLSGLTTEWAFNPRKRGATTSVRPTLDDFLDPDTRVPSQMLGPNQHGYVADGKPDGISSTRVALAAYHVQVDPDRNVVFCDVELNPGQAFFPLVRFAVARYQPNSIDGATLSKIVTVDFVQISPRRTVAVTGPSVTRTRRVTVSGYSYVEAGPDVFTSEIEVHLEASDTDSTDDDSIWTTLSAEPVRLDPQRQGGELFTWSGEVEEPRDLAGRRWRLTVAEYEYYDIEPNDVTRPDEEFQINKKRATRRLIFLESIYID